MKNILIIVQIVMLILELIKRGLEESEVIDILSSEYDVDISFIKSFFK
ncbi:hypothetical protein NE172_06935 [Clostridium botulinum]|nr:hypothetical protein [Clostridium botulinum]MBY6760899.1 hypothetical protein [Clostridium botulinum]MBY6919809.1 hypothetical protein [Clostridium botulinum]MCR1130686.1 hypothetical protein [Clostridium botulinum]HBZ6636979.1 hypothetical protein [Clostridium botulinum]HBZ7130961.1 hypothetical protein [Clostridium botulinum]